MNPPINKVIPLSPFTEEKRAAMAQGNRSGTTNAGLREVVYQSDPIQIDDYLRNEMGIGAPVRSAPEGIYIAVRDKHSFTAIWSALRTGFECTAAMTVDGRQAILVKTLNAPVRLAEVENLPEPEYSVRLKLGA